MDYQPSTRRRKLLLSAANMIGATFLPSLSRAQNRSVKIGFPVPLTGSWSAEANDQVRAAKLAISQFNESGGLNGRQAELLVRDDRLDVKEAGKQTIELIKNDGVDFIVGSLSAESQILTNKICIENKILFNSISQSDAINEVANASPYTFHEALNPHMTASAVARYAFSRFGKRVAYMTAWYAFGVDMTRGFQRVGQELGTTTVADFRPPAGTKDFTPWLDKIKELKPDIIVMSFLGFEGDLIAKQVNDMGFKNESKCVMPILRYTSRQSKGPEIFDKIIGGTSYCWAIEDRVPSAKVFNDLFKTAYSTYPSDYGALGYAGVRSVLQSVKDAQSTDGLKVSAAMAALKYDWYKGPQHYRSCDHQSVQSVIIVESKSKNMRNKFDVFNILQIETSLEGQLRTCTELGFLPRAN